MPRSFFLFLASLVLCPAAALAGQWIVLPDEAKPYAAPSFDAPRAERALSYPKRIEETTPSLGSEEADADRTWIEFRHRGQTLCLPEALLVRAIDLPDPTQALPIGTEVVDRNAPLPLDYAPSDLVAVDAKWSYHADATHRLRAEAARAALRMLRDAEKDKVKLRIVSSFRSAAQQRYLYLAQIEKRGLGQKTVAKPGHSEHQLGTALDLSGTEPATVTKPEFGDTREGQWLRQNAARYGFRFSYTEENAQETGYLPEPWHVRYWGGGPKAESGAQ